MLTIAKIISGKAGYEVSNDFCLVRDARKYRVGDMFVCKILSRFCDYKGNDHFVVTPIVDRAVTDINYALATKIYRGEHEGIIYILSRNCPQELNSVYTQATENLHYAINNATEYEKDVYDSVVQDYLSSLAV